MGVISLAMGGLLCRAAAGLSAEKPPALRDIYVIAYAADLKPAANLWAAYRASQGWQVITTPVPVAADPVAAATALRDLIRSHYAPLGEARSVGDASRFMVLLLGDAAETGKPGIPTWRFPQTEPTIRDRQDGSYASDDPYQEMNGDPVPDLSLGRVPARSVEEAVAVLEKIKLYEENREPGRWRRRVVYAAGEGRFGAFDAMFESMFKQMVERFVPDIFDVSMTYANAGSIYCPPPSMLSDTVLDRLREGALLFNYVGHGHATALDWLNWGSQRVRILQNSDLDKLGPARADLPIALLTCCSTGWYDLPEGKRSMAEEMLLHPGGPVAVLAGSRPTHPYANAVLQRHVTQLLLQDRAATIGQLDLAATRALFEPDDIDRQLDAIVHPIAVAMKWQTGLPELRAMHVRLYNLLGDPATRIAQPSAGIENLHVDGVGVSGVVPGMVRGRATISLEAALTSLARVRPLLGVEGKNDPELEAKAAHNYPLANDRVLERAEVAVENERFSATLDAIAGREAAVIKVYAVGEDAAGRRSDAFGAVRLSRIDPPSVHPIATGR